MRRQQLFPPVVRLHELYVLRANFCKSEAVSEANSNYFFPFILRYVVTPPKTKNNGGVMSNCIILKIRSQMESCVFCNFFFLPLGECALMLWCVPLNL